MDPWKTDPWLSMLTQRWRFEVWRRVDYRRCFFHIQLRYRRANLGDCATLSASQELQGLRSRCRSRNESEVFGWSRIANHTRSQSQCRSQIFLSDSRLRKFNRITFLHHTPQSEIPVEIVQFLLKFLLKQRILAVCHDFHWLLVATKLLTAKLQSCYVKESEILKWSETDILPPIPQPWLQPPA